MEEQRRAPRMEEQDYATVTVISAPEVPALERKTFTCLTRDVSVSGLQFVAFVGPPIGAILHLHVAVLRPVRAFNHIARVVWTKHSADATYSIGVEFTDTQGEAWAAWKTHVMQVLGSDARLSRE